MYPFEFRFDVVYALKENILEATFETINLGLRFNPLTLARHNDGADHLLQRLNVVRQGCKIDVHAAEFKPSPR